MVFIRPFEGIVGGRAFVPTNYGNERFSKINGKVI